MSVPECIQRLALPRLVLRTERDSRDEVLCGVWGGTGVVPLPPGSPRRFRHLIGIGCDWLEENGFGVRGCLSVYRDGFDTVVVHDPELSFRTAPTGNGVALFGREDVSWPGDEALAAYLTDQELRSLDVPGTLDEYWGSAEASNPLFWDDGTVAVFGGWHASWPDGPPRLPRLAELNDRIRRAGGPGVMPAGTTYRCEPYRLLLWTLCDSEPWYEVWGDGDELHAVARIT